MGSENQTKLFLGLILYSLLILSKNSVFFCSGSAWIRQDMLQGINRNRARCGKLGNCA